jgi:hypothetical protein
MLIDCLHIKASFPSAGYALHSTGPGPLQWDCHHATTFILRAVGLDVTTIPQEPAEAAITIEVSLSPREKFISEAERFAATQHLDLPLSPSPPLELTEPLTLSAAHVPEAKLFIFTEASQLTARSAGKGRCQLTVTGTFKARQVPCQETDLVIHLEKQAAARLLAFLLAQVR